MKSIDEQILRTTKEIVVKFIEMGRLSPTSIHESFVDIHRTVSDTVKGSIKDNTGSPESGQ
ncbi:conjugal transfer protein TraB [Desulfocicer niacini]